MDVLREIDELQRRLYELKKQVAGRAHTEELPDGDLTVLIARVGEERVAFLARSLDEVVPMARLTPMPESPSWVAGVLNLRGRMVPVIDVLARSRRGARRQEVEDLIVICRVDERPVGLVVQEIVDVRIVDRRRLEPPPQDVPFAPYLLGLLKMEGAPGLLLSIRRLAATSDLPEEDG